MVRTLKCLPLLLIFGVLSARAVNTNFTGTLIGAPACRISSGPTIDVDFGNVGINRVDGANYRKPMPYTIQCDPVVQGTWSLMLTLVQTGQTFPDGDGASLSTDVTGLGIKAYAGGQPFKLNTPRLINPGNPPALEVVPVKTAGVTLPERSFAATATLVAAYQ